MTTSDYSMELWWYNSCVTTNLWDWSLSRLLKKKGLDQETRRGLGSNTVKMPLKTYREQERCYKAVTATLKSTSTQGSTS